MRKSAVKLLSALIFLSPFMVFADATESEEPKAQEAPASTFEAFTGKITRNKVRMRIQPTLDGKIMKELVRGDMVIVTGEANDYYAVQPPKETKAYIFRTFVLDNVVEGKHVNIRIEPDLEAPIIGQLNNGDHVEGTVSPLNSKWLEIAPPAQVKFYISKEYVEKIGDASMMARINQRRDEVNQLLETAYQESQNELQKPFETIHIEPVLEKLHAVINNYTDFPDQGARAQELLTQVQDSYIQKKLAYLEAKAQAGNTPTAVVEHTDAVAAQASPEEPASDKMTDQMSAWLPIETAQFAEWTKQNNGESMNDFYSKQKEEAIILTGIVQPYIRHIRNKPGDYLLVSNKSQLPSAYLYSTKVDLSTCVGKEITIIALPRPNHNFAHPAYFVLSVE